jgi:TPR repeat protein
MFRLIARENSLSRHVVFSAAIKHLRSGARAAPEACHEARRRPMRDLRQDRTWLACAILFAFLIVSPGLRADSGDAEIANRHLRAAEGGNPTSQLYLGALYSAGVGVRQSDTEAFRWFLKAAEQGNAQAQVVVASLYAIGKGTPKDNKNAYRWAYVAAAGGDSNIRNGANQLMDVLATRMSSDERAEAIRAAGGQPGKTTTASTDNVTNRRTDSGEIPGQAELANSDAYYKRGQARAQRQEYALAIDDFSKAIELNPSDAEAFNNRCWVRIIVGRAREALGDCNQAVRLRPGYADALDSRGLAKLKLGEYDGAISDFNEALRLKPKLASSLFGRGKARLQKGNTSAGNADLKAARGLDPNIDQEYSRYGID